MYTSIRKYYVIPGQVDELMQRIHRGFVPIISDVSGFHRLLCSGNKKRRNSHSQRF